MNIHLLVVDPQRDFCDPAIPFEPITGTKETNAQGETIQKFKYRPGALLVNGADKDMERLSRMVARIGKKINDIHVTLDSHNEIHIAHPIFWVDSKGNHPNPFTVISKEDVLKGVWTTTNPACKQRAIDYVIQLEANKRYVLCVWNPHCIIGTDGWAIMPCLSEELKKWCKERFKKVDFVTKGSNVFTENYSAVRAEVPDNADPSTMLNTDLLKILANSDVILIAGEALSHCICSTITDVADNFGEDNIKKFVLLEDCCSNVGGFEKMGQDFVTNMVKRGMKVAKSTEYLS